MKTVILSLLSLVLIVFLVLALPVSGEEAVYENVIRLHILPDGEDAAAQNAKILVRDALLSEYGETLGGYENAEEAREALSARLPEIERFVRSFLEKNGMDYSVTAALQKSYFETRSYGEVTLPGGSYYALTVSLGEGKGQNWWCVLYPSLCTEVAMGGKVTVEEGDFSEAEEKLITSSGYRVKFRTLEILESIFS